MRSDASCPYVAAGAAWSDSEQTDTANGNFRGALSDFSGVVGLGLEAAATICSAMRWPASTGR